MEGLNWHGLTLSIGNKFRYKVGLPEVHLGLIWSRRDTETPRIVRRITEMITSGKPISAKKAQEEGLIDQVIDDTPCLKEEAIQYAKNLIKKQGGPRRSSERKEQIDKEENKKEIFENFKQTLQKKARGLFSPFKAVEAIEAAFTLPFDEGVKKERSLFHECLKSPQSIGLVHAFFSERKCTKFPEALEKNEPARNLEKMGVVGGGTMGSGITIAALDAGLIVTMIERNQESIEKGKHNVEKVYKRHIEKGRMTQEQVTRVLEI